MALSSFSIEAQGLDGRPYRVDVGSSPSTVVDGDRQFLVIEGGEGEDRGLDPIWPTELRGFARGIELDTALLSGDDRSVPVKAYDTTGGTDTLVFSGYLVVDFFGDAPFEPEGVVEIRALDGLGTLENDPLDDLFSGDPETGEFVSYQTGITRMLQETLGIGLDVEFGVNWYPDRSSIGSSDNPLESVGFDPDNYREDRPEPNFDPNGYESDFQSQLSVLRDLLKSMGATLRQVDRRAEGVDARWHVRQRDVINSDGTIKVWVYSDYTDSPSDTTLDRSRSVSIGDLLRDHSRDFIRRRQTVEVTHDHVALSNLIPDPGFEKQGSTGSSTWTLGQDGGTDFNIKLHDNLDTPRESTEDNKYAMSVFKETDTRTSSPEYPASAPIVGVSEVPVGTVGEFQVRSKSPFRYERVPDNIEQEGLAIELEIAGSYLTAFTTAIQEDAESFDEQLVVNAISRRIPEGARLPIQPAYDPANDGDDLSVQGTITLTEPAKKGTTTLVGNIEGTDPSSGQVVRYAGMSGTKQPLRIDRWKRSARRYGAVPIRFPWTGENGNLLKGSGTLKAGGQNLRLSVGPAFGFYDDFRLRLLQNGSVFDQTRVKSTVPELGETDEQTVRTSSGPTTENLARVRGNDPNGNEFDPVDWGVGASHTSNRSLAELKAFQRLRYWQNHLEELTVTAVERSGDLPLTGDELVTLDGTDYTVHSVRYDAAAGETRATLIEYKDFQ